MHPIVWAVLWFVLLALAVMTGALALLREVIGIYQPQLINPKSLLWASVRIAFIVSAFLFIWSQYREIQELKARLAAPNLVGRINWVSVAQAGDKNQDAIVTVAGTITNPVGTPSIAENWSLRARLKDSRIVTGILPLLPPSGNLHLGVEQTAQSVTLSASSYWPAVTKPRPIATGGGVDGWIFAVFKSVTKQEIFRSGSTVIVEFCDVTGKTYSIERVMTGESMELLDLQNLQKHQ